ncbi:hypothetical protein D9M68_886240 [compost metagenome]
MCGAFLDSWTSLVDESRLMTFRKLMLLIFLVAIPSRLVRSFSSAAFVIKL